MLTYTQIQTNLRNKNLTYLPSDKGEEFCIIYNNEYTLLRYRHLTDTTTYEHIQKLNVKNIEKKINTFSKEICERNKYPKKITKSYTSNSTKLGNFYILIKTHKEGRKVRPIITNIGTPTHKISYLLSTLLKPLLKHIPSHIENSKEMIERLNKLNGKYEDFTYPCSLDVVSMYTSISINDAI